MLASSRIGADEDINDYEGKTEEEINELIAAKVREEDHVTLSLFLHAKRAHLHSCNRNAFCKTEEEINELIAAKVRVADNVTPSLFSACHELIYSCNQNCILKVLTNKKKAG
jgi:hypothetical protein